MALPTSIVARRLVGALVVVVAVMGAIAGVAPASATVFLGILSGSKPASPPFVVSPNFLTIGPSGATIIDTITVTNLTTSPQTVTLTFGVHHVLTYFGVNVADGQPGQPGITFKTGDYLHTTQQVVGTPQVKTFTFPAPSAGPTTISFQQMVNICGYFQVDVGQHKTATQPQANLSVGFTRVLGCQSSLALPTLTTVPKPASAVVGATLNDAATLGGGSNPTGTITFTLYNPSNVIAYTETINVTSGNHTYSTSKGHVAGLAGIWHWKAEYSGDANNKAVASNAADEAVTVTATGGVLGATGGVLAVTGFTAPAEIYALGLMGFGGLAIMAAVAWRRRLT